MLLSLAEHAAEPLRSQIARQLRARILTGELAEGSTLPQCHRLARAHRVPALAVRQAYEALCREGLVEEDGAGGHRVGTFSPAQRRELAERRLLEELKEQELSITELELARDLQRRLLPPARVEGDGFAVTARSFPARVVTGDFYDVIAHPDGSVGVVVADVAGKGIAASLLMASVKAMTPFVAAGRGVEETLAELNRRLSRELGRHEFVALAYARFFPATGRLLLANAGLPDPLMVTDGILPEALAVPGPRLPLGVRREVAYQHLERRLEPGARLVLLSDGIAEARRPSGDPFGHEAVAEQLRRASGDERDTESWLDGALDRAQEVTGPSMDDDWTVVVLEPRSRERSTP